MGAARKRYKSEFKAKVALEALREQKSVNELSGQYGIHATQISDWKKVLQSQAYELFEKQGTNVEKTQAELIERLYCQVGQLQVELDWLKKNVGKK